MVTRGRPAKRDEGQAAPCAPAPVATDDALAVPLTDDVVIANASVAWAAASDISSTACVLTLAMVSHAWW